MKLQPTVVHWIILGALALGGALSGVAGQPAFLAYATTLNTLSGFLLAMGGMLGVTSHSALVAPATTTVAVVPVLESSKAGFISRSLMFALAFGALLFLAVAHLMGCTAAQQQLVANFAPELEGFACQLAADQSGAEPGWEVDICNAVDPKTGAATTGPWVTIHVLKGGRPKTFTR